MKSMFFAIVLVFSFNVQADEVFEVAGLKCRKSLGAPKSDVYVIGKEKAFGCPLVLADRYDNGMTSVFRLVSFSHKSKKHCFYLNASKNIIECK